MQGFVVLLINGSVVVQQLNLTRHFVNACGDTHAACHRYEKDVATGKAGKWKLVLGAGGTAFLSNAANGVAGKNISMNGYPLVLNGILVPDGATSATAAVEAGTSQAYLLAWTQRWNGTCHVDSFGKIFTSTSGTVRKFMGKQDNGCVGDSTFREGVDITDNDNMPY